MTTLTTDFTPCMGGWCSVRTRCPHYRSDSIVDPAERLCPKGHDGLHLDLQTFARLDLVAACRMEAAGAHPKEPPMHPAPSAPVRAHFDREAAR